MTAPAAGWYPDSTKPGTQRYWDGETWTEHHAPLAPTPAGPETVPAGAMVAGLLLGLFIPVLGVVVGLTQLGKKDVGYIFAVSLLGFVIWFWLLSQ